MKSRAARGTPCQVVVSALFLLFALRAEACEPGPPFAFRAQARAALDSLESRAEPWTILDRIILMHNLGFHKDAEMRERAEKLLNQYFPKAGRSALLQAYAGSLQMIRVSHRSTGSNVLRTISPFTKSPYNEAREGFREISAALERDSSDVILRTLRATAATESAEHLPELLIVAYEDLSWLELHADSSDSVIQFFIQLNWAKYYYKCAKVQEAPNLKTPALTSVERALSYACTAVYKDWAADWRRRIDGLPD